MALHHTCMQNSHTHSLQHEPTGPDHQICGLPELKSQHLYQLTHYSPVISWTPRKLRPVTTSDGNMNVWSNLYRATELLQIVHFHLTPHRRALSRCPGKVQSRAERVRRRRDAVLTSCNEPLDSVESASIRRHWEGARRDTPELMHGLALTNFLDCNTRRVECSTC